MQWPQQLTKWRVKPVLKRRATWKLVSPPQLLDEVEMGQASVIRIAVLDASGNLKPGVKVYCDWEGRPPSESVPWEITEADGPKKGKREFPMGQSTIDPEKQKYGVYFCWVEDRSKSDEVRGLGLVYNKPTSFEIKFKLNPMNPKSVMSLLPVKTRTPKRHVKKPKPKRLLKK